MPAKAGIQYTRNQENSQPPRILDHPLSRMTTAWPISIFSCHRHLVNQRDLFSGPRRLDRRSANFEIGEAPPPGVRHRLPGDGVREFRDHPIARALVDWQRNLLAAFF